MNVATTTATDSGALEGGEVGDKVVMDKVGAVTTGPLKGTRP